MRDAGKQTNKQVQYAYRSHGAVFAGIGAKAPVGSRTSGCTPLAHGEFFARALGVNPLECLLA